MVRVLEPSVSPTVVPCCSFLESVPGACCVKKFIVAPESKITKTVFCTVLLEVSSLQLNVKLFNVCSRQRHLSQHHGRIRETPRAGRPLTVPLSATYIK